MRVKLVDPRDESRRPSTTVAPRLPALAGRRLALIDISKPGGSVFLDRLEARLQRDARVASVQRVTKPAFSKRAPASVLDQLRDAEAVVLALAD